MRYLIYTLRHVVQSKIDIPMYVFFVQHCDFIHRDVSNVHASQ
jgi:hypothetical protein